jgi:putative serine protease PepD
VAGQPAGPPAEVYARPSAYGQPVAPPAGQAPNQPAGQGYGQPVGPPPNQPQASGQPPAYGQPYGQPFGQPPAQPGGAVPPQYGYQTPPAPVTPGPVKRSTVDSRRRAIRNRSVVTVAISAILAAALAAAGTGLVLYNRFEDSAANSSTSDGADDFSELGSGKNPVSLPPEASGDTASGWVAVAEAVQPSVVAIQVSAQFSGAEGSGVIINAADGLVLTNYHVVAEGDQIQVALADGRLFEAEVKGFDVNTDLAVLKLAAPPDDLTEATLGDSDAVVVGESVMAVGNPLGYDNTVTTGIVSALNRPVTTSLTGQSSDLAVINVIQVDAAINPGNSGGPSFNSKGEVIGINSSIATLSSGYQAEAGSIGLAFAIPSNLVKTIVPQLIEKGTAEHAYLGVSLEDTIVTYDGITRPGVKVTVLYDDTVAVRAGLQVDDVILAINDNPTTQYQSLQAWVRCYPVGQEVTLLVLRGTEIMNIKTVLDQSDAVQAQSAPQSEGEATPGQEQGQVPEDQVPLAPGYENQIPGLEEGQPITPEELQEMWDQMLQEQGLR